MASDRPRRLTLRAAMIFVALFGVDFAGWTWCLRHAGPTFFQTLSPLVLIGVTAALLGTLIAFCTPPRIAEILIVALILAMVAGTLVPALSHSNR